MLIDPGLDLSRDNRGASGKNRPIRAAKKRELPILFDHAITHGHPFGAIDEFAAQRATQNLQRGLWARDPEFVVDDAGGHPGKCAKAIRLVPRYKTEFCCPDVADHPQSCRLSASCQLRGLGVDADTVRG